MATATITFGTQAFTYNTDTLVIQPAIEFDQYKVLARECSEKSTFANGDVLYLFENEGSIDCIISTNGDCYVGDYRVSIDSYMDDMEIKLVSCE
jgi:hypothetical protein